jgi:hypothetical protein
MSFLSRLGLSLLLFGLLTLVADHVGYVPRKLAKLPPEHMRTAGIAFLVLGAVFLVCSGPKARKVLGWAIGIVVGGILLFTTAALLIHKFGRRTSVPDTVPTPVSWSPPVAPATPSEAPTRKPASLVLLEKRRTWESSLGRQQVWSIVIHLAGKEPPADLQEQLQALVKNSTNGGVAISRVGSVIEITVAPLKSAPPLENVLKTLFPTGRMQSHQNTRRFVVFVH